MSGDAVAEVLAAAEAWLFDRDTPEAVVGRAEAGRPEKEPGEAARWVRRIVHLQSADGSWDGDLTGTATALLTIRELMDARGLREQDPAIGRALHWLLERRGVPGAWTDGCSPDRHRLGICHHFMGGFFSPAPPEVPVQAVLRTGASARTPREARFMASATALRGLLAWTDSPGTDSRLHLQGLRHVVRRWNEPIPDLGPAALLAAVHALLGSEAADDRDAAQDGLGIVAGRQRGDGSWVGADPFQALEVFLAAESVGVCADACHQAIWHGTRLLVSTQNTDGHWGTEAAERRVLIGCRALRSVARG